MRKAHTTGKKTMDKKSEKKQNRPRRLARAVLWALAVFGALLMAGGAYALHIWQASKTVGGNMFTDNATGAFQTIKDEERARLYEDEQSDGSDGSVNAKDLSRLWIEDDGQRRYYNDEIVNILFLGIDREGERDKDQSHATKNGGNADAIVLASLDTAKGDFFITVIPRDTMANVIMLDGYGNYYDTVYTNISASHSYGDGGDISCELTTDAVSTLLLGVPVSRYAALAYEGLDALNELIGGLTMTFDEDYSYIDPAMTQGASVTLTNRQLRLFAGTRDIRQLDSSVQRSNRLLPLCKALFAQCKTETAANPGFPVQAYLAMEQYVTTNLSIEEISYFARTVFSAGLNGDMLSTLQGEVRQGELYAEYYADEEWLRSYSLQHFFTVLD